MLPDPGKEARATTGPGSGTKLRSWHHSIRFFFFLFPWGLLAGALAGVAALDLLGADSQLMTTTFLLPATWREKNDNLIFIKIL